MASNNGRPNNPGLFAPNGGGAWKKPPVVHHSEKAKNFPNHDNHKKQVVVQLSELFGKVLDKEIISSVALNCGWDVDSAIEALIEISKDASMPVPSKLANTQKNYRGKEVKAQEPPISVPALKAIRIAYQGYDDSSDDADVLVEEEEEFEIVVKAAESAPPAGNHVSRGVDQKPVTEAKKVRKISHSPTLTAIHESISRGIKIVIIMRGAPGSGKTFAARQVLANSLNVDPNVYIFSTDDYFCRNGRYVFQPQMLPEAHEWNRRRVHATMQQGQSPVVVDNTNVQAWEMKPYLHLATQYGYAIELLEPNTPWCFKEAELAQRNCHGVARQNIRSMLERYEKWNVNQLLSSFKLKYSYGNIPPQRCTNPPKPKNVKVQRPSVSPRKKASRSPVIARPPTVGAVNGAIKVGDEAGYYGPLPNSPVAAQSNGNGHTVEAQRIKPSVNATMQLLLNEMKPMQQVSPARVIKETRTEGMEQFLSKLPAEISVQKLVNVEQSMRDQTRSPGTALLKPSPSEPTTEGALVQPKEEMCADVLNLFGMAKFSQSSLEMKDDVKPSLKSSIKLENSPLETISAELTEEEKLKMLDQEVDEKVWETFLNHKVGDNVEVTLPDEVKVERVGASECGSIIDGGVSPCWEYSLVTNDSVIHQKDYNETVNKTDDVARQLTDAQTIHSVPVMETLTNVEKVMETLTNVEEVMDRVGLPSSTVSADQMLTCSSIEQSDEVFVSDQPVAGSAAENDVKETHLPKLNLFSWLFPKKLPDVKVPESNVKGENGVAREPWQLYQPCDSGSIDDCSLLTETCKLEPSDSETVALAEIEEIPKDIKETSSQNVDETVCVDKMDTVNDTVNEVDTSMGPVSFLLDAVDFSQKDNHIPVSIASLQVICETDKAAEDEIKDSESVSRLTEETSDSHQNVDSDSTAQIVAESADEGSKTSEDLLSGQETSADSEVPVEEAKSIAETLPGNEVPEDQSAVTVINLSEIKSIDNVETCPVPSSNADVETEESIPDISSNINVDCWAKLSPTYVLSEEGAHMIPLQLKTAPEVTSKPRDVRDCGTNTVHSDFSLLDDDLPVLTAHNRSINTGASVSTVRPLASAYMLDKGSMTSPVDLGPGQNDFVLLVNMFPKIPKDDLMEVFEKCQREINWTVDVLLESGYAFEPSEDLEIRFGDTEELQHTQDLLEELNSRDFTYIRPDIVNSSLETNSNTPKKYTQLEEFKVLIDSHLSNFEKEDASNTNVQQSTVDSAPSSPSKKPPKKQSQLTLQLKKQMEDSFVLSEESYSEETLRVKKMRHGEVQPSARTELPALNFAEHSYELPKLPDSRPDSADLLEAGSADSEEEEEGFVPLTLDTEFLKQLQSLFGEVAFAYPEGVSAVVDLPVALARQIHGYLMESQQQQLEKQEEYFENMIKDEEFARRLQAEELPPPDFRQIMDMEMALELYRTDASNLRRETKEDMATRLSKQKLFELFPNVDREMLTDVFVAHDYSFAETLEVLEASTGEPEEAVRTVMSPEAMLALEKQLIDKAKQESNKQSEDRSNESCTGGASGGYTAANQKELAIDNAKYYREEANRLVQLRNECYQKANQAHRNNQAAVASYYAQVGHLYKQRIEEANSRAASALLSAQAQRSTTLDLHYLYVAEALQALDIFVDHHIARLADTGNKTESLYIITGSGVHSVGGRPRIRPAVQARLCQRRVRFVNVNSGLLKATITRNLMLSNGTK